MLLHLDPNSEEKRSPWNDPFVRLSGLYEGTLRGRTTEGPLVEGTPQEFEDVASKQASEIDGSRKSTLVSPDRYLLDSASLFTGCVATCTALSTALCSLT